MRCSIYQEKVISRKVVELTLTEEDRTHKDFLEVEAAHKGVSIFGRHQRKFDPRMTIDIRKFLHWKCDFTTFKCLKLRTNLLGYHLRIRFIGKSWRWKWTHANDADVQDLFNYFACLTPRSTYRKWIPGYVFTDDTEDLRQFKITIPSLPLRKLARRTTFIGLLFYCWSYQPNEKPFSTFSLLAGMASQVKIEDFPDMKLRQK